MIGAARRILGIDPGSARMGFGVVECTGTQLRALSYGCVETRPTLTAAERLVELHQELASIIRSAHPTEVAVEELFFAKNARTVISVAEARGVALMTLGEHHLPVFEYTPLQVKVGVVGYGKAEKRQVQHMVTILLHLAEPPRPDDAADALAIAICHCHQPLDALR
ncbi:MAG: crossover junction endodeoxyribonuclease RuvC [Chloroflexi bacterium]|nr:crossover junction endodeoxyribonuclease RuvC [Chloroflexota bacterium]